MRIEFEPDRDVYPFESHYFDATAGRVHYIDEGKGPAIVFFHGNPTWSFLYRKIVTALRDRFRCIAVDYPGFGLSDRPEGYGYSADEHAVAIGELVDHLDLSDFVAMGQDWGGPIGLRVATQRADRVRGLVLGNTWFWPMDRIQGKIFSKTLGSPPFQWAILKRNFFVERIMPFAAAHRFTPSELDHYRKVQPSPEARRGVAEFPRQILGARPMLTELAMDVPARLGDKPTLLVWGMKDPAFPAKWNLPRMEETFTEHELVRLPEAKHYIQEDAPKEISEAIARRFG